MTLRRIQGWALVVSAVCLLLGSFLPPTNFSLSFIVVGTILLILSSPSLQTAQNGGRTGWIGILLLEIAAFIALAFQLGFVKDTTLANGLGLTSAITGMLGRFSLGGLTIRRKILPMWVGWAFLLSGVLNLLGGFLGFGSLGGIVSIAAILLEVAALLGYGYGFAR
jgi:hypothetical protein